MDPFLKWAGGKRWLIPKIANILPSCQDFNTYIEPFLGGGSIYFHLRPPRAILSDLNADLINTFVVLKDNWEFLEQILHEYQNHHSVDFYYQMRSQSFDDPIFKAARFIYLNRTCWNGLYRVNKLGQFNVPIGTKNSIIQDKDNFELISQTLTGALLYNSDFEEIINLAQSDDFIFIDPPYTVKHNLNGFVKYNENIFSWQDQVRLRDCVIRAINRNVKILVTNADHKSIRDLYKDVGKITKLDRKSVIAGSNHARGIFSELIIKNW